MTNAANEETRGRRKTRLPKTNGPKASSPASGQRPVKPRRRPALIALGLALAVLGGLGSFYYASTISNTISVLQVKDDIARGAEISAENLTTLEIIGGQGTGAYTPDQADQIVGKLASVDLPAGTLITANNVGESLALENGQSIVGVALTAAQMPSFPLTAGTEVRIVSTPVSQGEPPASTPDSFPATVFTARFDEKTSLWIVDLVLPESKAADLAARASTGRVALIVDSAEGN